MRSFFSENRGSPDSFRAPWGYGVDRGDAANRLERGVATGYFGKGACEERYWPVDQYNANAAANPIPPTADNLKAGQNEYEEHCATCHGLAGRGSTVSEPISIRRCPTHRRYPKVIRRGTYFVIAHGIRMTAMPAFAAHHSPDEIWRTIL